jgi:hypothetical protein
MRRRRGAARPSDFLAYAYCKNVISEYNAGPSDDIKADIWKGREKLFEHHKNVRFFSTKFARARERKGVFMPDGIYTEARQTSLGVW